MYILSDIRFFLPSGQQHNKQKRRRISRAKCRQQSPPLGMPPYRVPAYQPSSNPNKELAPTPTRDPIISIQSHAHTIGRALNTASTTLTRNRERFTQSLAQRRANLPIFNLESKKRQLPGGRGRGVTAARGSPTSDQGRRYRGPALTQLGPPLPLMER
eukprot:scaffold3962_cov122-Isochrysis_galbana.AAC.3